MNKCTVVSKYGWASLNAIVGLSGNSIGCSGNWSQLGAGCEKSPVVDSWVSWSGHGIFLRGKDMTAYLLANCT